MQPYDYEFEWRGHDWGVSAKYELIPEQGICFDCAGEPGDEVFDREGKKEDDYAVQH